MDFHNLLEKWLEEEYQLDIKERELMVAYLSLTLKCLVILPVVAAIVLIPIFLDYGRLYIFFPLSIVPVWIALSKLTVLFAKYNKIKIRKLRKMITKEFPEKKEQLEFLKEMTGRTSKKVSYTYGSLDNHIVIGKHFMLIKTYRYLLVDLRKIEVLSVKINKSSNFFHCKMIIMQSGRRLKAEIVSLKAVCEVLRQLIAVLKSLNVGIQPNAEAFVDKISQSKENDFIVEWNLVKQN